MNTLIKPLKRAFTINGVLILIKLLLFLIIILRSQASMG